MRITKVVAVGVIAAVLALAGATPANAVSGREGSSGEITDGRTGQVSIQQTWLQDPNVTSNRWTARSYTFSRGTVEVRVGTYQGVQYGWGRALNASGYWIRFEVDLNGDRSWDEGWAEPVSAQTYTAAYPTSSSPNRAFRACIVPNGSIRCNSEGSNRNATTWW